VPVRAGRLDEMHETAKKSLLRSLPQSVETGLLLERKTVSEQGFF
jgi:hypothetical protein